jgi:hypothetical protein
MFKSYPSSAEAKPEGWHACTAAPQGGCIGRFAQNSHQSTILPPRHLELVFRSDRKGSSIFMMWGKKVDKTWSAYVDRISILLADTGVGLRYLILAEEGSSSLLV